MAASLITIQTLWCYEPSLLPHTIAMTWDTYLFILMVPPPLL